MTAKQALRSVRTCLDKLRATLDTAAPFLPLKVRVAVPLVDALDALVDAADDASNGKPAQEDNGVPGLDRVVS